MARGLVGIAPRDEIERMIVAEMIAAHGAVMECYRRAGVGDDRRRLEELRNAARLSGAFVLLVKALHRYRAAAARRDTLFGRPMRHHAEGDQTLPAAGHDDRGERSPEKNRGITPCSRVGACARPARPRRAKAGTDADASKVSSPASSGRSSSPSVGRRARPHRLVPPGCGVLDGPLEAGHDNDQVALDLARMRMSAQNFAELPHAKAGAFILARAHCAKRTQFLSAKQWVGILRLWRHSGPIRLRSCSASATVPRSSRAPARLQERGARAASRHRAGAGPARTLAALARRNMSPVARDLLALSRGRPGGGLDPGQGRPAARG
jgi:hypothetical protein